jgi:regulator of RNase E activity RraA
MAVGLRVFSSGVKVGVEVVNRFRKLPVANVSDAMNRMSAGGTMLRPMHAGSVLAGAAVTVSLATSSWLTRAAM